MLALGVELALHNVILAVHRRQPSRWLNENESVHAIGNMHPHRGSGTVIDVQPRVERHEGKLRTMARGGKRGRSPAARASDGVQIDIMGHLTAGVIIEMEFDNIPLAHPDKFPWHTSTKGPEVVLHAICQALHHLPHLQVDHDFGRMVTCNRRGDKRCVSKYRGFLALYGR